MKPRTRPTALFVLFSTLLLPVPTLAQSRDELAQELAELSRGQQQIRRQLAEIKQLLEGRAAPRPPRPPAPTSRAG